MVLVMNTFVEHLGWTLVCVEFNLVICVAVLPVRSTTCSSCCYPCCNRDCNPLESFRCLRWPSVSVLQSHVRSMAYYVVPFVRMSELIALLRWM